MPLGDDQGKGEAMEEFQYDPQHRREVEGWNIICFLPADGRR